MEKRESPNKHIRPEVIEAKNIEEQFNFELSLIQIYNSFRQLDNLNFTTEKLFVLFDQLKCFFIDSGKSSFDDLNEDERENLISQAREFLKLVKSYLIQVNSIEAKLDPLLLYMEEAIGLGFTSSHQSGPPLEGALKEILPNVLEEKKSTLKQLHEMEEVLSHFLN